MSEQLYEIIWRVKCCEFEFLKTELKVFNEESEAKSYAVQEQTKLNGNMTSGEKSWNGYCYEFWYTRPVFEIDGYSVIIEGKKVPQTT